MKKTVKQTKKTIHITERLGKELLFFDGGMGTLLQDKGLKPGELPETWNMTHKEEVIEIHRNYFEAGSDIVLANTFGANRLKFHDDRYDVKEIVTEAVSLAKEARRQAGKEDGRHYVALDMGPTGRLLKPMGDLDFEEAYEAFKEVAICAEKEGADLVHIETMSDTYEVKAAVLAVKEHTDLPVFATMIFDEKGSLLTGGNVEAVVALLEGLRVDALGMNCGLGPKTMLPLLQKMREVTSIPIVVKPNAGLPKQKDGQVWYDVEPEEFGMWMKEMAKAGACLVGGCCGTTPQHIRAMTEACTGVQVTMPSKKHRTVVSSYGQAAQLGEKPLIIGERINPTGKKRFRQALKEHDMEYILQEGLMQQEMGAHILDVNVGLPDINEAKVMREVMEHLQSVTSLPLQIDTVDAEAMETALRRYNGKAMINSVNGKQESMDMVFPLAAKYGGVIVGLTLDEEGIPSTVEGRVKIADKIIREAAKYGIAKEDIVIDVLAMTISSEPEGAKVVLQALREVRQRLGVHTVLGVSNISFGLPNRPAINAAFYTLAMEAGLSAGIVNPASEEMMQAYHSYLALINLDPNCEAYIAKYANYKKAAANPVQQAKIESAGEAEQEPLMYAVEKGLKEAAGTRAAQLLETQEPLFVINEYLVPALDRVGQGFEKGTIFLPQLLLSAEAAKEAFKVIKEKLAVKGVAQEKKNKVILATVKGDIHDIGKNIVKVLMENYGFDVIDLGKDVAPERIVRTAVEQDVRLVGLSALMTTTVVSMEETIACLRKEKPDCKVMVGGAVLNQEYADMIGADFYGKDAMQSVSYAKELFR